MPPDISVPSNLSFSQSSCDLPSLIDHHLTDTVSAEMDIIASSMHTESADRNDFRSDMSTPPLCPDTDIDIILPASDNYTNGIFPDKIDNLFVSQSPSNDQSVLDCLMNDCPVGSSDMISKQLDMDVNNLLGLNEDKASKTDNEKESCGDKCSEVVNCPVSSTDIISEQLDMEINNLLRHSESETTKSGNGKESFEGDSGKAVDSTVGSSDVISGQLDMEVSSLLQLNEGQASTESCENVHHSRCEDVASFGCDAVVRISDITNIAGTFEMKSEMAISPKSDLASLQNVDAYGHLNCDTSSAFPFCVQQCSAEPNSDHDKQLVNPLFIVPLEKEVVSESQSQLPTEGSEASRTSKSEDIEPALISDVLCDSSSTDANFVPDLSSAIICSSLKRDSLLLDHKTSGNGDVKMGIVWPSLSDNACDKNPVTDLADEFKLFPNMTTTIGDSFSNTATFGNACHSNMFGSFPSKAKGTSHMPCIASFSSSNSDDWSFDESWLPDWKLQTNAVVQLKRLALPADQYSLAMKCITGDEHKGTSSKSQLQSGLTLVSVQPLLSNMTSEDVEVELKHPATEEAAKASPSMSERSSFSALLEDMPIKQLEQVKVDNRQSSVVEDIALSSSSSSSLSSSGTKPLSFTVASAATQQKHFSYADYCNNPRYQPVVQLVRLPLEFFRMLQQTSQPVASSSVSVSDLQKRFVILYCKL